LKLKTKNESEELSCRSVVLWQWCRNWLPGCSVVMDVLGFGVKGNTHKKEVVLSSFYIQVL